MVFDPNLTTLPAAQLALWPELAATPEHFTLYGGTALALRLGHRPSIDFDFFSNESFDPEQLAGTVPYLRDTERVQLSANTLTCRVERRGRPVLVSFFGGVGLGRAAAPERAEGPLIWVASLLDIAGTKAAVIQKRAEAKDYIDLHALLQHGVDLAMVLAAGSVVHGQSFNPLITLKALSYFDDVPALPEAVRADLVNAVKAVDATELPVLSPQQPLARRGVTP